MDDYDGLLEFIAGYVGDHLPDPHYTTLRKRVGGLIESNGQLRADLTAAKAELSRRRTSEADALRLLEECEAERDDFKSWMNHYMGSVSGAHVDLDHAGVPSAVGLQPGEPDCNSLLEHRVRCLVYERDRLLVECEAWRSGRLRRTHSISDKNYSLDTVYWAMGETCINIDTFDTITAAVDALMAELEHRGDHDDEGEVTP
jgi:hypothetical protein